MQPICDDLAAEYESLDSIVAELGEPTWNMATPAPGWTVKDQIAHLAFFDGTARIAVIDAEAFKVDAERLVAGEIDPQAMGRDLSGADLLEYWRKQRADLLDAFRSVDAKTRLPWYGPDMSARTSATARLMETWAHGQDIADALGIGREPTDRLRNVAHLCVSTRAYSYIVNAKEPPDGDVRVELAAPSGAVWTWGDAASTDRVTGPGVDFCLVATRRRHPDDTDLLVSGPLATEWIAIAQAFAGPPGEGRQPGQFR